MKNEEKAREIAADGDLLSNNPNKPRPFYHDLYVGAMEMAEWKDEQMKKILVDFMQYLDKRGFIQDDLCFDIEHQVETFIELRNRKNIEL